MKQKAVQAGKLSLLLTGAVIYNFLIYNSGRMLATNREHYSFAVPLDYQIPFLPETVLVYWGGALFWGISYYLSAKYDRGNGYRFIGAHFIGETICFLCFVCIPTTMIRPDIGENSLSAWILRMTYQYDAADNLFPSIHCFVSWLCWIGVRKNPMIPRWYRVLSALTAGAVCVSTLTVKQHVLADVAAGIILAEGSYRIAANLERKMQKILLFLCVRTGYNKAR